MRRNLDWREEVDWAALERRGQAKELNTQTWKTKEVYLCTRTWSKGENIIGAPWEETGKGDENRGLKKETTIEFERGKRSRKDFVTFRTLRLQERPLQSVEEIKEWLGKSVIVIWQGAMMSEPALKLSWRWLGLLEWEGEEKGKRRGKRKERGVGPRTRRSASEPCEESLSRLSTCRELLTTFDHRSTQSTSLDLLAIAQKILQDLEGPSDWTACLLLNLSHVPTFCMKLHDCIRKRPFFFPSTVLQPRVECCVAFLRLQ